MTQLHDDSRPATLEALLSDDLAPAFWMPELQIEDSRWWPHVPFAFWLVAAIRPARLVELGTGNGVSYAAFCEAALTTGGAVDFRAVDLWEGEDGAAVLRALDAFHGYRYSSFSRLVRADFAAASETIPDKSIDLLHLAVGLDAKAARETLAQWRPKMSQRGIVLLHGTRGPDRGLAALFTELRAAAPHFEFPQGDGLGLIALGLEAPALVGALCSLSDAAAETLRARFAFLGGRWEERAIAFSLTRQFESDLQRLAPRRQRIRFPLHIRLARSVLKTLDDPLRYFRKGTRT